MLPVAVMLLKFGAVGAGFSVVSKWFEKSSREEKQTAASPAKADVAAVKSAAAAGALLLLAMDACLRGMFLILSNLQEQGLF